MSPSKTKKKSLNTTWEHAKCAMYDCKGRLEMHMYPETVARNISKWAVTEEAEDCKWECLQIIQNIGWPPSTSCTSYPNIRLAYTLLTNVLPITQLCASGPEIKTHNNYNRAMDTLLFLYCNWITHQTTSCRIKTEPLEDKSVWRMPKQLFPFQSFTELYQKLLQIFYLSHVSLSFKFFSITPKWIRKASRSLLNWLALCSRSQIRRVPHSGNRYK